MKMQWEKLPERLQSEALKCLMCNIMRKYANKLQLKEGFADCCAYMTRALTMEDDAAFAGDVETLLNHIEETLDQPTVPADLDAFLEVHAEYIKDRVKDLLSRATECPDFKDKLKRR